MMVIPFFGGVSSLYFSTPPLLPAPLQAEEAVSRNGSFRCAVPGAFRLSKVFPLKTE